MALTLSEYMQMQLEDPELAQDTMAAQATPAAPSTPTTEPPVEKPQATGLGAYLSAQLGGNQQLPAGQPQVGLGDFLSVRLTAEANNPSILKELALGSAETVGGIAAGGIEWLVENVVGLSAAVYAQTTTDMSSEDAIKFGKETMRGMMESFKDWLPEDVSRFLGRPETEGGQNVLGMVSFLLENTVGWAGEKAGAVIGGIMTEAKNINKATGNEDYAAFLEAAIPWAKALASFGTEIVSFKAAHSVGKHIARKVGKGEVPPEAKPPETRTDSDLAELVEKDFTPEVAKEGVKREIKAEEAIEPEQLTPEQAAALRAEVAQQFTPSWEGAAERTLSAHERLQRVQEMTEGELLTTNRGRELREQTYETVEGTRERIYSDSEIASILREEARSGLSRAVVAERSARGGAEAKASVAEVSRIEVAARERLGDQVQGARVNEVTGRETPFGDARSARQRANKLAGESGSLHRIKKVPGEKAYVLEEVEAAGREILNSRGKPYASEKAALRQQTILERSGVTTRVEPEGGGFKLVVEKYTPAAAKSRIASLEPKKKAAPAKAPEKPAEAQPLTPEPDASPIVPEKAKKVIRRAKADRAKKQEESPFSAEDLKLYDRAQTLANQGADPVSIMNILEREFKIDGSDAIVRISEMEKAITTETGTVEIPEKWRRRMDEKFETGAC